MKMKWTFAVMLLAILAVGCGHNDREDEMTSDTVSTTDSTTYRNSDLPMSESIDRGAMGTSGAIRNDVSSMSDSRVFRNKKVVEKVQTELNDRGYSAGSEDGIMGPNTKRALTRFQRHEGISSNGVIDFETLRALDLQDVAEEALSE